MKDLIYINACMRASSRTRRIATPIIEKLREIEERVSMSIGKGLEICKTF